MARKVVPFPSRGLVIVFCWASLVTGVVDAQTAYLGLEGASVNTQNRPLMDTSKPATTSRSD